MPFPAPPREVRTNVLAKDPKKPASIPASAVWEIARWHDGALVAGLRSGVWRYWSQAGVLVHETTFVKGYMSGPHREWYEDGRPAKKCVYRDGMYAPGEVQTAWTPADTAKGWRPFGQKLSGVVARVEGVFSTTWTFRYFDGEGNECTRRGRVLDPLVASRRPKKPSAQAKLSALLKKE